MATEKKIRNFVDTYEVMCVRRIWHADNPQVLLEINRWFDNQGDPMMQKLKMEHPNLMKELGYE